METLESDIDLGGDEALGSDESIFAEDGEVDELGVEDSGSDTDEGDALGQDDAEDASAEDRTFRVKVNGEVIEVTEAELVAGYQRQRDYTQKTQELAAERQRLAHYDELERAFQNDPVGTLQRLADAYGLRVDGLDVEPLDESERRVRELEERLAAQERARQIEELDREVAKLHEQYGEFDERELFEHAVTRGITSLEVALRDLLFDKRAEREAKSAEKRAAKREAAVVSGGTKRAAAATKPNTEGKKLSIREAWAAARRQLG